VSQDERYWFRAKRYGWGWGPPVTWQGWIVMIVWFIVIVGAIPLIDPRLHPIGLGVFVTAMIIVLLAICLSKGEPPRWRWGE
jgi:hypothetical protein